MVGEGGSSAPSLEYGSRVWASEEAESTELGARRMSRAGWLAQRAIAVSAGLFALALVIAPQDMLSTGSAGRSASFKRYMIKSETDVLLAKGARGLGRRTQLLQFPGLSQSMQGELSRDMVDLKQLAKAPEGGSVVLQESASQEIIDSADSEIQKAAQLTTVSNPHGGLTEAMRTGAELAESTDTQPSPAAKTPPTTPPAGAAKPEAASVAASATPEAAPAAAVVSAKAAPKIVAKRTPFEEDKMFSVAHEKTDMDSFFDNLDDHAAVQETARRDKRSLGLTEHVLSKRDAAKGSVPRVKGEGKDLKLIPPLTAKAARSDEQNYFTEQVEEVLCPSLLPIHPSLHPKPYTLDRAQAYLNPKP
ncbi:hypothetical protein T484DRAFT_2025713 [Baffinella frigidus]|nr:hypothetical protein T484DRAFT_2025713 [Cryptophyta sp. CCMP2293]